MGILIGIVGCKHAGKDTTAKIIQALDIYRSYFQELNLVDEYEFVKNCLNISGYFTKLISRNYYSKYETHAFADNLKQCISIITGININNLYKESFKESFSDFGENLTYRQLMQLLGTEVCQTIDKEIWVKSLFQNYGEDNWIITDVRFKHEADYIIRLGGILLRINREEPTNEHSSETGLKDYESITEDIDNSKDLDYLISQIKEIMLKYNI